MKKYAAPKLTVQIFSNADIITTSGLLNSKTTLDSYTRGSKKASAEALGLNS